MTNNELEIARLYANRLLETYTNPTDVYLNEQISIDHEENNVVNIFVSGSNDGMDWGQNLAQRIVKLCDYCDYPFHKGFARASDNVMRILANKRMFDPKSTFNISGHSKGGPVAVAVGLRLAAKGMRVKSVVSFASPKFSTQKIPLPFMYTRYVTVGDIVPNLPKPTIFYPFQRWVHQGLEHILGKEYDENLGIIRDTIDVHMISYYIKCLNEYTPR